MRGVRAPNEPRPVRPDTGPPREDPVRLIMDDDLAGKIIRRASRAGVEIDLSLAAALAEYVELVKYWNRRVNLTGLSTDARGLDRLVIEPVVAAQYLPVGVRSVIDLGSGGGSPAVPLKLVSPGLRIRMVESRRKKAVFLRELVRRLGIEGVAVDNCRYEKLLEHPEVAGTADVVTVRGLRVSGTMLDGLSTLVRSGGLIFLFRGGRQEDGKLDIGDPLVWQGSYGLVDSLKSRLVILKRD